MTDKRLIQEQVDKTLESLNDIQRAEANPYLFNRIKQRLQREERSVWTHVITFISRPAIAIAAIVLLLMMNASIIFKSDSSTAQIGLDAEQAFATEYSLSDSTIYDSTIDPE